MYPCVGAVIRDEDGRLLLVLRGHEPAAGLWSLPGGRVEPGETDETALAREVLEETGLEVSVGPVVGKVRIGDYVIADHACTVVGGAVRAGDDAADVRWVEVHHLDDLPLTDGLVATLREWGVL
jgi:ADP-ribose pyrophosphatase YjhB (NUDIX family)